MFRCRETTDVYLSTYYVRASLLDVSVESLNRIAIGAVELSPHRTWTNPGSEQFLSPAQGHTAGLGPRSGSKMVPLGNAVSWALTAEESSPPAMRRPHHTVVSGLRKTPLL